MLEDTNSLDGAQLKKKANKLEVAGENFLVDITVTFPVCLHLSFDIVSSGYLLFLGAKYNSQCKF